MIFSCKIIQVQASGQWSSHLFDKLEIYQNQKFKFDRNELEMALINSTVKLERSNLNNSAEIGHEQSDEKGKVVGEEEGKEGTRNDTNLERSFLEIIQTEYLEYRFRFFNGNYTRMNLHN